VTRLRYKFPHKRGLADSSLATNDAQLTLTRSDCAELLVQQRSIRRSTNDQLRMTAETSVV
jgi:hypothetical protein